MSKEDIDRAVREAEKFAEEDRKLREAADTINRADSLVFQVEKTLGELGDKLSESDKAEVKEAIEKLKAMLSRNSSTEELKAGIETLEKAFYALSEKLYSKSGAAGGQEFHGGGDGTYYNADFEDKTK